MVGTKVDCDAGVLVAAAEVADGVGTGVWARAAAPNTRLDMLTMSIATMFLVLIQLLSLPFP
jgi:hypothetical protein